MYKKKKLGRNDKCHCNSDKKYKVCCLKNDILKEGDERERFTKGHEYTSDNVREFNKYIKDEYGDFRVIDVSNYLDPHNYEQIQLRNYNKQTFIVAEKNEKNIGVFIPRAPEGYNFMVLYNGAYRCFSFDKFERAKSYIYDMFAKAHGL